MLMSACKTTQIILPFYPLISALYFLIWKGIDFTDIADKLLSELGKFPEAEAIALGGSRASDVYDEKSDYDVYVYVQSEIPADKRSELFSRFCTVYETGNHYWETEDNCTLNNGIDIDIIYRDLDNFAEGISRTVDGCEAANGYTTCMWHKFGTI